MQGLLRGRGSFQMPLGGGGEKAVILLRCSPWSSCLLLPQRGWGWHEGPGRASGPGPPLMRAVCRGCVCTCLAPALPIYSQGLSLMRPCSLHRRTFWDILLETPQVILRYTQGWQTVQHVEVAISHRGLRKAMEKRA